MSDSQHSHTSLLHGAGPSRHLQPGGTSAFNHKQNLAAAVPVLVPLFKATEPEKAQRACPQGKATLSQRCGTEHQLLRLTSCCYVSAARFVPFDLLSDLLNCSFSNPSASSSRCRRCCSTRHPTVRERLEQDVPFLQLLWTSPSPGDSGLQLHCCSSHAYPSVPRAGVLRHGRGCLWRCCCCLLWVMSWMCDFTDNFFLLFIFAVNDFKAKTYLLSSINSLLKVPWSWKGENCLFLPKAHPPAGPGQTWAAAVLLPGSCQLEGDVTGLQWRRSPCVGSLTSAAARSHQKEELLLSPS